MANRYWVGGTGTWNSSNTTNWSATSGGAGGASVPTSVDDVFFDGNSGTGIVTGPDLASRNIKGLTVTGSITLSNTLGSSRVYINGGDVNLSGATGPSTQFVDFGIYINAGPSTVTGASGKNLKNFNVRHYSGAVTLNTITSQYMTINPLGGSIVVAGVLTATSGTVSYQLQGGSIAIQTSQSGVSIRFSINSGLTYSAGVVLDNVSLVECSSGTSGPVTIPYGNSQGYTQITLDSNSTCTIYFQNFTSTRFPQGVSINNGRPDVSQFNGTPSSITCSDNNLSYFQAVGPSPITSVTFPSFGTNNSLYLSSNSSGVSPSLSTVSKATSARIQGEAQVSSLDFRPGSTGRTLEMDTSNYGVASIGTLTADCPMTFTGIGGTIDSYNYSSALNFAALTLSLDSSSDKLQINNFTVNTTNQTQIRSGITGSRRILSVPTSLSLNNVYFRDIEAQGLIPFTGTDLEDGGNNINIAFPSTGNGLLFGSNF